MKDVRPPKNRKKPTDATVEYPAPVIYVNLILYIELNTKLI